MPRKQQGQGLVAVVQGLVELAEPGVQPTDRVERARLHVMVGGPEQRQGPPGMVQCLLDLVVPAVEVAAVVVRVGQTDPVPGPGVEVEGPSKVLEGLDGLAEPGVDPDQATVGEGLGVQLDEWAGIRIGGGQGGTPGRGQVLLVALPGEKGVQDPGQLPGPDAVAVPRGPAQGGQQDRVLIGEPDHRGRVVVQGFGTGPGG
jgi:hypothetical protein